MHWKVALLLFSLWLTGCATYSGRIEEPRRFFEQGQYDAAIEKLKGYAAKQDGDELLYLMDLGSVYHAAGRYQEAIDTFLKADKLAEIKDYTSLSAEVGSVILNDDVKTYKGENFEKVLINMYLAIDYTMLHRWDDALVECRRVNRKLELMISQGGLPYEQNAFAKYLDAVLFEARKEWNDAFVDYRTVLKWQPDYPYLPAPLIRSADKLAASEELAEYKRRFPKTDYRISKSEGEVVVLLEVGRGPVKVPSPDFPLLPKFHKRSYSSDYVWLRDEKSGRRARTYTLFDVENAAIKDLDNRIAGMAAKKVGGIVAKELIAAQVASSTNSKTAGILTSIFLHATDHADLRSWSTLPAHLQLARLVLPAGRHDIVLDMVTTFGNELKGVKVWKDLNVKPGETVFLNFRMQD